VKTTRDVFGVIKVFFLICFPFSLSLFFSWLFIFIKNMASSAGGSELFSNYEQDFTSLTEGIKIKIEKQIANQTGGKANSDIRGVLLVNNNNNKNKNRGEKSNNPRSGKRDR
jgi:hypothetical protein